MSFPGLRLDFYIWIWLPGSGKSARNDGLRNASLSAWELREAQKYEQWVTGSRDPLSADIRTSLSKGEDRTGLRKVVRICGPLTCPEKLG